MGRTDKRKKKPINILTRNIFNDSRYITKESLRKLAESIVSLVDEDENILTFSRVISHFKLYRSSFYSLMKRSEDLKKARDYAFFKIGMNREELALKRKIDGTIMKHQQGIYDPEWKAQDIFHADIRKTQDNDQQTKIVIVKDFSEVPKKKDKEVTFDDISKHIEKI